LVALGAYAVKAGYNVLHYTLELGEGYVGKRYDASLTGINVSEISSKENVAKVTEEVNQLPGKLIIKEYSPGIATIDTVRAHIEKVKNLGTEPDLIIIDYADLMGSRKKSKERKDSIDDIYLNTKGLARELNLPIWSVSQVNRAGAKDDIIEGDKAAGSYDKIMITDFALSLSRKREDKVNGTGRFHLIKNRYGMDGMTYGVKADTNVGRFEVFDYDEDQFLTPQTQPTRNGELDSYDKKLLANEFFKLKTNGNIPT
jgi:replicative DNA helicase